MAEVTQADRDLFCEIFAMSPREADFTADDKRVVSLIAAHRTAADAAGYARAEAEIERLKKQINELAVAKRRLEYSCFKLAAPEYLTQTEQEALDEFTQALRAHRSTPNA